MPHKLVKLVYKKDLNNLGNVQNHLHLIVMIVIISRKNKMFG